MQGIQKDGYTLYQGIRYARAGRFEEPVLETELSDPVGLPPVFWQAGRDIGSFYDKEFYDDQPDLIMDEDAFFLNLYVPDHVRHAPVAVWIHGGAFDHGYSFEKEFEGASFARNGVLLVQIAYRVGIPGFYTDGTIPANLGLKDQACALQWVYENITRFGGDPDNITLFGQSAGCMSVMALLSSPASRYVSKAILQSGCGIDGILSEKQAKENAEGFLQFAGIDEQTLFTLPASELIKLQTPYLSGHPLAFAPVAEEGFLPSQGCENWPDIPVLLGSTYNDIFTEPEQLNQGVRGVLYEGCLALAEKLKGKNPVYMYDFIHPLPGDDAGAFHSSELWYVFNTLSACWRPVSGQDYALAKKMHGAWIEFIKTGSPGWAQFPVIEVF